MATGLEAALPRVNVSWLPSWGPPKTAGRGGLVGRAWPAGVAVAVNAVLTFSSVAHWAAPSASGCCLITLGKNLLRSQEGCWEPVHAGTPHGRHQIGCEDRFVRLGLGPGPGGEALPVRALRPRA